MKLGGELGDGTRCVAEHVRQQPLGRRAGKRSGALQQVGAGSGDAAGHVRDDAVRELALGHRLRHDDLGEVARQHRAKRRLLERLMARAAEWRGGG